MHLRKHLRLTHRGCYDAGGGEEKRGRIREEKHNAYKGLEGEGGLQCTTQEDRGEGGGEEEEEEEATKDEEEPARALRVTSTTCLSDNDK